MLPTPVQLQILAKGGRGLTTHTFSTTDGAYQSDPCHNGFSRSQEEEMTRAASHKLDPGIGLSRLSSKLSGKAL